MDKLKDGWMAIHSSIIQITIHPSISPPINLFILQFNLSIYPLIIIFIIRIPPFNHVINIFFLLIEPSISSVSLIRTDIEEFNISLTFDYLGAASINRVVIAFRPIKSNDTKYIHNANFYNGDSVLEYFIEVDINDRDYAGKELEFNIIVINSDEINSSSKWIKETTGEILYTRYMTI